jgi:hypothetical protein
MLRSEFIDTQDLPVHVIIFRLESSGFTGDTPLLYQK